MPTVRPSSTTKRLEIVLTRSQGYGIHLRDPPFEAPYREGMCDKPQPWHDELFYYVLRRELDRMQKGKAWKWAEVRCDLVVSSPRPLAAAFSHVADRYAARSASCPTATPTTCAPSS